jgi:hypothetical protein
VAKKSKLELLRGGNWPTMKLLCIISFISGTKEFEPEQLKKMLEKSKINGGEIMATLAQRWLEQGEKIGLEKGIPEFDFFFVMLYN